MRLPLWRLLLGLGVMGILASVLIALGPVYIDDFQLKNFTKALAAKGGNLSDEAVRGSVAKEAHRLELPVKDGDIQVTHPGGKLAVEIKYIVEITFPIYSVDLHFHTTASGK